MSFVCLLALTTPRNDNDAFIKLAQEFGEDPEVLKKKVISPPKQSCDVWYLLPNKYAW